MEWGWPGDLIEPVGGLRVAGWFNRGSRWFNKELGWIGGGRVVSQGQWVTGWGSGWFHKRIRP